MLSFFQHVRHYYAWNCSYFLGCHIQCCLINNDIMAETSTSSKMAFQLLSVSALFLSLNFPSTINFFVQLCGYPEWDVEAQQYLSKISLRMERFFLFHNRRIAPVVVFKIIHGKQQEPRM